MSVFAGAALGAAMGAFVALLFVAQKFTPRVPVETSSTKRSRARAQALQVIRGYEDTRKEERGKLKAAAAQQPFGSRTPDPTHNVDESMPLPIRARRRRSTQSIKTNIYTTASRSRRGMATFLVAVACVSESEAVCVHCKNTIPGCRGG